MRDRMAGRVAGALAWSDERLDLSNGGETDPVDALMVSGRFFETLGVQPALGRLLTAGRRSARRRPRRPDAGHQRALLGAPLPARPRRRRPLARGQRRAVHDRRRRRRRGSSAPPSAARSTSRCRSATIDLVRPGGPQSALDGRIDVVARTSCSGRQPDQSIDAVDGGAARRAAADPRGDAARLAGRDAGATLSRRAVRGSSRRPTGLSELRRHYREPLLVLVGIVGARAARRLRQRRQPAAGARRGAAARAVGPAGPRRLARPAGPAAPDREPAPRRAGRRSPACCSRCGARASWSRSSAPPTSRWRSRCRSTGGCSGSWSALSVADRRRLRPRPGVAGAAPRRRRGGRARQPQPRDAARRGLRPARRRPDRAVAGARRRRRPLRPHVLDAGRRATSASSRTGCRSPSSGPAA